MYLSIFINLAYLESNNNHENYLQDPIKQEEAPKIVRKDTIRLKRKSIRKFKRMSTRKISIKKVPLFQNHFYLYRALLNIKTFRR